MKALLLILILYLSNISCDDIDKLSKNLHLNSKKLKSNQIHMLNSAKNIIKYKIPSFKVKTKKLLSKSTPYTAFPSISAVQKKRYGVPDSPYFPLEKNFEQKPRVKKTLPDTKALSRRKRSVVESNSTNEAKIVAKIVAKTVAKTVTKTTARVRAKNVTHVKRGVSKRTTNAHKKAVSKHRRETLKFNKTGKKLKSRLAHKIIKKKRNSTRLSKNKKKKTSRIELTYKEGPGRSKSKMKKHNNTNTKAGRVAKSKKSKNLRHGTSRNKRKRGKVDARRVIAGRDATIEEFPYVVSIQKRHLHWCTGALLNPRLVITTANCLWKSNRMSRLRVRAGSRYIDRGGQVVGIQEVMKHPAWGIRRDPDNDVALIVLDKNIRFSDNVHGADLPNRAMMPAFEDAWIASWGADRRDGIYDNKDVSLQAYHARVINRSKCNNMTKRFGVSVTENFFCLAQTGKRAPCTRDTGAPAVSDGVIWGLASWGIRKLCGTERFPSVFSYIGSDSNMDFIANATHYLMSDERLYPYPGRLPSFPKNG